VGEGSGSLDIFLKTTVPYSCWWGRWRHSGGDALNYSVLEDLRLRTVSPCYYCHLETECIGQATWVSHMWALIFGYTKVVAAIPMSLSFLA
jgi:hypothetical protein